MTGRGIYGYDDIYVTRIRPRHVINSIVRISYVIIQIHPAVCTIFVKAHISSDIDHWRVIYSVYGDSYSVAIAHSTRISGCEGDIFTATPVVWSSESSHMSIWINIHTNVCISRVSPRHFSRSMIRISHVVIQINGV